jgi:hypothetical protein
MLETFWGTEPHLEVTRCVSTRVSDKDGPSVFFGVP